MHAIVHAADLQDRDGGALVMATLFGLYPFLLKLYADGGYQGPDIPASPEEDHVAREHRDRQALRHGEEVRRVAEAMDRRAHIRVAGAMSLARQGLGEFQSESARVPASRVDPPHAEKAMQSRIMFPDRLLDVISRRCRNECALEHLW